MLCNKFDMVEIKFTCIKVWGTDFVKGSSVFSIMVGWIAEILSMVSFAYIVLKIPKYEVC